MKTLFRFIVLVLLVAGWGLAALGLHVVRTPGDRVVIIPKQRLGIEDTYIDARAWTAKDAADHPALIKRILQSGKSEHFAYLVNDPKGDVPQQLEEVMRNAPTTKPQDVHHAAKTALSSARKTAAKTISWWELGG